MTNIIDGKAFAAKLRAEIAEEIKRDGLKPGLTVILVGDDPASHVYVANKDKAANEVGINAKTIKLPADTPEADLLGKIAELNNDSAVHGILVQLPLPKHIDENAVINAIFPDKDVDGFHVINAGRAATGQDALVPCTPLGCSLMLKDVLGDLSGLNAVVIGRSNIVGKPMANLLLKENCTVTIAHSRTKNLAEVCAQADILVAAVGRPKMVKANWVKDGAVVIDVGINRQDDGKLCGDVDFAEVAPKCKAITPVPGGVGPMTIACLLKNTVTACRRIAN
ncbi:MAG: bifunctional methylenetetrahydrofolate dehydrogenase/methenyltetrahydrofolate cyclohydrolase FolD [Alphaproteobacteria bacterium CG11_big_fil_rev_8_21_14_0_20_44_7]|nr:MAG: bifunctional methylenetetrahydrofolate dehydrogenase/methenyltetrahydrofolate cyclohydrolase FolD [Alphaproteobacteria bacterium CG11_big_fil_rev_8_21_14_0_20_44_7]